MDVRRLVGLDVARCLALLGMVATHVLDERAADGGLNAGHWLAGGRASALFAVLAGVSLALMSGRREPLRGAERRVRSAGLAARALLVALLGLVLAGVPSGLAVILTNYGVLFLLGLLVLGLRAPALAALATVWVVAAPVVSQVVRPHLPERQFDSPGFDQLATPGHLLSELMFTGYYPVFCWLAYLFVGMALGRSDLSRRSLQAVLAVGGFVLAVAATLLSNALTARPGVTAALLSDPTVPETTRADLLERISAGVYGVTPTGGPWEWLLVVAPHSATPFDLAQTIGSALCVIGLCLLVAGLLGDTARRAVAVFFGAGTMTLTLYSLHVVMRAPDVWPAEESSAYVWHVLVLLGIGALFVANGRRGPIERVVGAASAAAERRAGGPDRRDGRHEQADGRMDLGTSPSVRKSPE